MEYETLTSDERKVMVEQRLQQMERGHYEQVLQLIANKGNAPAENQTRTVIANLERGLKALREELSTYDTTEGVQQ